MLSEEEIAMIEGCCLHFDDQVIGSWFWSWDIDKRESGGVSRSFGEVGARTGSRPFQAYPRFVAL